MTTLNRLKELIKDEVINNDSEINSFDIQRIAIKFNSTSHDIITALKLLYLEANPDLCFNLYKSRNSVKIMSVKKNKVHFNNESLKDYHNISCLSGNEIKFVAAPFYNKASNGDIIDILNLYAMLIEAIDNSGAVFFAIENVDVLYGLVKHTFTFDKVLELYKLIRQYGYTFERDGVLYWKTANSQVDITKEEIDEYFTVIKTTKDVMVKEEAHVDNSPVGEIEETPAPAMTTHNALSLIAKELGISLDENESRQRLEELVATTNELILNFDELEDWEKLRNWDKFVKDWQSIMGEAVHDRN